MKTASRSKIVYTALFTPLVYSIVLLIISPRLSLNLTPSDTDVLLLIAFRMITGAVYLFLALSIIRFEYRRNFFYAVFALGLLSRILLVPSQPILEDDFNRYLWDGAVTANLINPYEFSPEEVLIGKDPAIPSELKELIDESGNIFFNINHPHIRTIYPMLAQVVFAFCYLVDPFNLIIWKLFLLLVDIFLFFLLIKLLNELRLNRMLVFIYWLNPILIHEFFNAGHMDLLIFPFIVLAVIQAVRSRYAYSVIWMTLAAGLKLWPVVLLPVVAKRMLSNPKRMLLALGGSALLIFIMFTPVIMTNLDQSLGFVKYASSWVNNESLFRTIMILNEKAIQILGIESLDPFRISRWVTVCLFVIFLAAVVKRDFNLNHQIIYKMFLITTVLYFISPTQFPWYYTWILPMLVFNPRFSLMMYAALLPLYHANYLGPYLVWIQHLPVFVLFILEERGYLFQNIRVLGVK